MLKVRKRDSLSKERIIHKDKTDAYRKRHKESSFDESKHSEHSLPTSVGTINQQYAREVDRLLWISVIASLVVGVVCLALLGYWCILLGGFGWTSDPQLQFNLHPLLMVLGLIFFYGNAIMSYRVLYFLPKRILKLLHAALHLLAAVLSSVGLVAVFERNRQLDWTNLFSLHSWLGLATFGFFCLQDQITKPSGLGSYRTSKYTDVHTLFQFVGSFITFLYPGLPSAIRARVMPFHTFFGIGIFAMAVCSAQMGLNEKLVLDSNYKFFIEKGVVGNIVGLLLIVYSFLVIFVVTHGKYKRKPLPVDFQS